MLRTIITNIPRPPRMTDACRRYSHTIQIGHSLPRFGRDEASKGPAGPDRPGSHTGQAMTVVQVPPLSKAATGPGPRGAPKPGGGDATAMPAQGITRPYRGDGPRMR